MKDRIIGEQLTVKSAPLRWIHDKPERILYVEKFTEAYAETASDSEASCPVCPENNQKSGEKTIIHEAEPASQQTENNLKMESGM